MQMHKGIAWPLFVVLLAGGLTGIGAGPAPAPTEAFMGLQTTYLSFEITQAGSQDFGAPKDSLTDGAYRVNKSMKFEMPFNMPLPGSCPSGTPLEEAMEEGRCMGWAAMPPDDPELAEQMMSGKLEMAKNPMFVPVEFSVDDVSHFRYRDSPSDGWATGTRTSKGSGITYVARTGMLLCDFKKMMCDVSGVPLGSSGGGDEVTITTTSDVPGFETQKETMDPTLLLPQVPQEVASKLIGFSITLPGPSTMTASAPGEAEGGAAGPDVVMKVTLSSKSVAKSGTPSK